MLSPPRRKITKSARDTVSPELAIRGDTVTVAEVDDAVDLEELNEFLSSDAAPDDCMRISDLDGFLTAIAIGPELIKPSQWLPVIWRGEKGFFEDTEQGERIYGMIFARYNLILRQLAHDEDEYGPLFWESEDGTIIAMDWAEGFMEGVQLTSEAWVPLLEDPEGQAIFSPIVSHLHDDEGNPLLGDDPEKMDELYDQAAELIPSAVIAIDKYWKARRPDRAYSN
jgi:uncharacterized protein